MNRIMKVGEWLINNNVSAYVQHITENMKKKHVKRKNKSLEDVIGEIIDDVISEVNKDIVDPVAGTINLKYNPPNISHLITRIRDSDDSISLKPVQE